MGSQPGRTLVVDQLADARPTAVAAACKVMRLTERQQEVLELLLRGRANKDVARELRCSVKNAEYLVGQILKKAGCANRLELVAKVLTGDMIST